MDAGGFSGASADSIVVEINRLTAEKEELEGRIRALEAQLKLKNAPPARSREETPPNGLSPEMIYRYSRHLLLPDFGVEERRRRRRRRSSYYSTSSNCTIPYDRPNKPLVETSNNNSVSRSQRKKSFLLIGLLFIH